MRNGRRILLYVFLWGLAGFFILPIVLALGLSLSTEQRIFELPPNIVPTDPQFDNYGTAVDTIGLGRAFVNSSVIAGVSTITNVLFGSMAGYAFARLQFRGHRVVFAALLATLMLPLQIVIVPLFVMFSRAPFVGGNDLLGNGGQGLLNTFPGLILPTAVSALYIFLFRQYFLRLPLEYADAARVDGAGEFAIFWRIYMPLARPIVATVSLLAFIGTWNELIWPLVAASTQDMWTLQVALVNYQSDITQRETSLLMAGNVISFAVPVMLFALFQRHFIRGIAVGGLKG